MSCKLVYKGETFQTEEDILNHIKVYTPRTLFQLNNPADLSKPIEALDKHLLNFLKEYGVASKQFDDLKARIGVDALGATDVLNKLIWYTKERKEDTIPEEAMHMAVMLMGESHPDIAELLRNITKWDGYKQVVKDYMPIYKNEKQVKIEAVGKVLAQATVKNYKVNGLDKNLLERVLDYIKNLL